jgi:sensor histidine kinase YesM
MTAEKIISSSETPARGYKRRVTSILIHKPMQREFIFVIVALLMVSTLAIAFVIHHTINTAIDAGGFRFGTVDPYQVLSDISYQLIVRVALVLFATLVILGLFGIFFLHRVAGPVYRFRLAFLKVNKGEIPPPVKLREGDFFQETADEINKLLTRLQSDKEKSSLIQQKVDEILASNPPEPIANLARKIRESLNQRS